MGTIAAFFDIDGTLFRNSLMIQHFKKLIKYEVIDESVWHTKIKRTYREWQRRHGDFEDYLEELADVYVEGLKGVNKNHIDFIASQVINLNGDKVYKYSRSRIKWHKKQNHKIFFVSGSPDFLVSKMAEKYGVKLFRASEYIVDSNNNFTGEIKKMWDSENKQKVINEFVEKYNVDLSKSYSYGDTQGDISMLKIVKNPIAINPNKELLQQIKDDSYLCKNTIVIVERKDIVYRLNANVDTIECDSVNCFYN